MAEIPTDGLAAISSQLRRWGIALTPAQRERILAFLALLEHWNRRINLTGDRERGVLLHRHVLDCLMLEALPRPAGRRHWLDVGSGAGLPGLLIAIMHPEDLVTAVESAAKKATFLQHATRTLGLANVRVVRGDVGRLEPPPPGEQPYDVLVARAFADLERLLGLSARLLPPGAELWAMKGVRWEAELNRVPGALRARFDPQPRRLAYDLAPGGAAGVILVFRVRMDPATEA
jgi:16S rRNA (guanine527-N7)-methyltransferase